MMDHEIHPVIFLTPNELAATECHLSWWMEAQLARAEEEANIEEALDALKVAQQP